MNRKGSLWINCDINLSRTGLSDGNKHLYFLTTSSGMKNAWEDNTQYATYSSNKSNS